MKTYGREDYERGLFDQANREVVARDSKRMWASLTRGIVTACITIAIMSVVAVFIAGGNAWYGITPGTLVVMFTYTYTVTNQFNFINNGLQRFNLSLIHISIRRAGLLLGGRRECPTLSSGFRARAGARGKTKRRSVQADGIVPPTRAARDREGSGLGMPYAPSPRR